MKRADRPASAEHGRSSQHVKHIRDEQLTVRRLQPVEQSVPLAWPVPFLQRRLQATPHRQSQWHPVSYATCPFAADSETSKCPRITFNAQS